MKHLNFALFDFTRPNENFYSREYRENYSIHNNLAHTIGDFCKRHKIPFEKSGVIIFETKRQYDAHLAEWLGQVRMETIIP